MTRGPVPSMRSLLMLTVVVVFVAASGATWLVSRVLGLGDDVASLQQTATVQDAALREANRRLEARGLEPVPVPEAPVDPIDGQPGATGEPGDDGADGQNGATGADGARGPRGLRGFIGPVGPAGAPGADGSDGQDGANGTDGSTGEPGPVGPPGPQGDRGATGATGADGQPGSDGTDGRGIEQVNCDPDTQQFVVLYDDGTSQPVEGSDCSASLIDPGPQP